MQGRRVYPDGNGQLHLEAGDYGQDGRGKWHVCTPQGQRLPIPLHVVSEDEDGTISVSPTIVDPSAAWHGYLIRGQWFEVEQVNK